MSRLGYRTVLTLDFLYGALNRDLKLIFVSNLIGAFGDGLYVYLLPLYARKLGANPVEVGIMFSIVLLVASLTPIPGGILADKYDRKKIMIYGWLMWLPVPVIFSMAKNWIQLLPGAVLYGCWIGQPASTAYIATSAEKDKITLTFAMISASWAIGYIFSPALGGYLSVIIGMESVFLLVFIFYALCLGGLFLISSQYAKMSTTQTSSSSVAFQRKKILVWSVYFAAITFFMFLMRPFVPQFLKDLFDLSEFHIGVLGSVTFFGSALLGILLGRIGDTWTKAGAVSVSMILCSMSAVILVLSSDFFALILACFLMGISYTTLSFIGAVVGVLAPEASRARWMSVPHTMSMLAAFIAPYLGGLLYEVSPYNPFIVTIVATPLLSVLAFAKPLKEGTEKN